VRILQIHCRYRQAGGEDAVVAAEAALLRAAGHEVVTHAMENPERAAPALAALAASPWNPRSARRARAVTSAADVDIAHVHNTWFAASPSVVAAVSRLGVPTVMTLHNYRLMCANYMLLRDGSPCTLCVGDHPWHAVRHACYRGSRLQSLPAAATIALNRRRGTWERSVDTFVALTAFGRDRFVEGGLPADKIEVLPHSTPDPGPRPAAPSTSDEVLFVGRVVPEKGLATIVQAWEDARPPLRLTVIGDGPDRTRLEARDVAGVTFVGQLPAVAVRQRMLAARALVFPSLWYETFGLVAVEAMAAGMPVLASDLGSVPDVVGDGGWLAAPGDARAWGEALAFLGDEAVDRVGLAARLRWQEHYSPAAGLRAREALYARVVAAHRDRRLAQHVAP
jgi:glycosyltransferase involved in cell wall biosynthesis